MREVAKAAGVHVTTVSLALRNSPQLPTATRERIKKLADKMGYRVNPLVSAFVQQRRQGRHLKFQACMGFITHSSKETRSLPDNPYISRIFNAASEHALKAGFRLEHFEADDFSVRPGRLGKVLQARGIRGLLFPPPEAPAPEIPALNWEDFACVTLSTGIQNPAMDCVTIDHFGGARLAVQTLWNRGYRRPGFMLLASTDERTQSRWYGGYFAELHRLGIRPAVPPLLAPRTEIAVSFSKWFSRWKPDVVISNELCIEHCTPAFKREKIRIPEDLPLVELNIHKTDSRYSGISGNIEECSRGAVDILIAKLYRNETGLPVLPKTTFQAPLWQEGKTLPKKH